MKTLSKHAHRTRKATRTRARLRRVSARPRLSVFRSLNNISCQIIDDSKGHTLCAASSLEKDLRGQAGKKSDIAAKVGTLLAERARRAGVTKVAFDRASYKFHGRIKALADAARKGGLEF